MIRVERVSHLALVDWARVSRGEVRVVIEDMPKGPLVVVSKAALDTLEHGERFEVVTEPPRGEDRCLECGVTRFVHQAYHVTPGCSMCDAIAAIRRPGRRWAGGAWR